MKLLDLFCGAGGAAMGYHRAGFTRIVGVDNRPQKRYPFEFVQADALEFLAKHGMEFDVIHASPPCKGYTQLRYLTGKKYVRLIPSTRNLLNIIGKPYIIENVGAARKHLINPLKLCGTMFGLRVQRHRYFECMPPIYFPPAPCCHNGRASGNKNYQGKPRDLDNWQYLTVTGHDFKVKDARIAMDIDWMAGRELSQAIPPAYTEWLGKQILALI